MSRIHISLVVKDLDKAKSFYNALFGEKPVVEKEDYAKWTPEHLPVNFTIVDRQESGQFGAVHFGIEAQDENELSETIARLEQATQEVAYQDEVTCCYHKSKKAWGADADAYLWEAFLTSDQHPEYGEDSLELKSIRERALR